MFFIKNTIMYMYSTSFSFLFKIRHAPGVYLKHIFIKTLKYTKNR